MQEDLNRKSLSRVSLNCSVLSILIFATAFIGVSVGTLPRFSNDPDLFIIISLWIVILIALIGVVIGVIAYLKSGRSDDQKIERKRAIAGITAALLISISMFFVLIYYYKERLSRGRLGRDTAAIEALVTIHKGQGEFLRLKRRMGTSKELAASGLIAKVYA
jgi:drug/metabolite transporter (DMT)-like permease